MDGSDSEGERREVRRLKNERCKFHISMKLEKMAVSSVRSRIGEEVSKDAIMGVKKSCGTYQQNA